MSWKLVLSFTTITNVVLFVGVVSAFTTPIYRHPIVTSTQLCDSNDDDKPPIEVVTNLDYEDDAEKDVKPGKMRVSEIKAELDIRGIDYTDCFDKESLATRLRSARESGKANPSIIDKFNKAKLEENFKEEKLEVDDEVVNQAVANDGKLPGGMDPEMFKKLTSDPEIMALLQSTKMQDAIKLVMSGSQGQLEEAMSKDPEMAETVKKLDSILGGMM